jgi:hypothetical protein
LSIKFTSDGELGSMDSLSHPGFAGSLASVPLAAYTLGLAAVIRKICPAPGSIALRIAIGDRHDHRHEIGFS